MDYLLLAKALMEEIKDPTIDKVGQAQLAQAAALIAIAERRPQFVQVGIHHIKINAIEYVAEYGSRVAVYGSTDDKICELCNNDAAAFLAWWNEYADVVQLPQVPDAPRVEEDTMDRRYDIGLAEIRALGPGPEKAIQLAVDGLATEGVHHKQWYLEEIAIALGVNLADVWTKFEEYGYEEPDQGIAPS